MHQKHFETGASNYKLAKKEKKYRKNSIVTNKANGEKMSIGAAVS